MQEIVFTKHALMRINDRGTNLDEVKDTVLFAKWSDEKYSRFSAVKKFVYNQFWEGIFYRQKEVKVIFVKENDKIIIVTAIVRYFKE